MSARVHRLTFDTTHYQSLLFDGDDRAFREWSEMLTFDGTPFGDRWEPPPAYIPEPKLTEPDFWEFVGACLVCGPRALDVLEPILLTAGELLPLPVAGMDLHVLNVTRDIDCLDPSGSTYLIEDLVETYCFHEHRLPGTALFKIPQTDIAEVLCLEGRVERDDDFKLHVERAGLTGLEFTELWDSHEGPRPARWDWS